MRTITTVAKQTKSKKIEIDHSWCQYVNYTTTITTTKQPHNFLKKKKLIVQYTLITTLKKP